MSDEASSTITWETIAKAYKERAASNEARIKELMQRANHWHDTAEMLKRQRNTAERELDSWKVRAKTVEEQREAARDEADRWKVKWVVAEEEAGGWKIRAMQSEQQRQSLRDLLIIAEGQRDQAKADAEHWKGEWAVVLGQLGGARAEVEALRKYAARLREAIDIFISFQGSTREPEGQAALTAALAVPPTKYKLPFIAHEKCYDYHSCARNQRCMYGKIGATGKWDNCFTPTSPALAVQPTTGEAK